MASAEKKPRKGILKNSSSFDQTEAHHAKNKGMKWDEMNILATHHPADKDYGHMKIDEPPTPYSKCSDPEDEDDDNMLERRNSVGEKSNLDPASLTSKLEGIEGSGRVRRVSTEDDGSSDEDEELTEEQLAEKRKFEQKRKLHYNEFQAVKLAKQLMDEDDDDDEGNNEGEDVKIEENNDDNSQDSVQMQTDSVNSGDASTSEKGLEREAAGPVQDPQSLAETTMDAAGHLETTIN